MSLQETFYAFGIATMALLIINYFISIYIGYKIAQLISIVVYKIKKFRMPRIPTPRLNFPGGSLSL